MKSILFYGDSLTAGYGLRDSVNESFPGLIQNKISKGNYHYKVINAGVSGDTSAGGLGRLDYWLKQPIDVFILELGVNDIMRGVPPDTIMRNLQAIITRVRSRNPDVKIALMGMELPLIVQGSAIEEFRLIYRKLADKNSLTLFPFFLKDVAGQRHLNLGDGLHPSAEGYKVISENVWPVIEGLLE